MFSVPDQVAKPKPAIFSTDPELPLFARIIRTSFRVLFILSWFGLVFYFFNDDWGVLSDKAVVKIDPQPYPYARLDARYISFGLDTSEIADDVDKLQLDTERLKNLTSLLGPSYLRLGGTMSDRLLFMENPTHTNASKPKIRYCYEDKPCLAKFLPFFVMSGDDWMKINKFCTDTGTRMLFDFNVLLRNGEEWDPSDAERLLKFTVEKNIQGNIDWQLGNEPNSFQHVFNQSVSARQLSKDFIVLKKLLQSYVPGSKLVGPDTTRPQPQRPECVKYMKEFLDGFKSECPAGPENYLDAIGWHQYYLNGRTATLEDFWNPKTLDLLYVQIRTMIDHIRRYLYVLPMWLTETSSAYGGGAPGLSNSYAGTALWLDKLGLGALNGIELVVRQSLIGGNYSLIGKDLIPLPDWWVSYVFRKLVGDKVLKCNTRIPKHLRMYCHCSKIQTGSLGSVTVFGINLGDYRAEINFSGFPEHYDVEEYILTPPSNDRLSKSIELNGKILKYDGNVPNIKPNIKEIRNNLYLPAYSIGFWVIHHAQIEACNE